MTLGAMFDGRLARRGLAPDGAPIVTHSSRLSPVRRGDVPAIRPQALCARMA